MSEESLTKNPTQTDTKMLSQKEMFDQSLKLWNLGSQLNMLAEEASELTTAALHLIRDNKDKAQSMLNLAEEIADVEFMLEEIKYYFKDRSINGRPFFIWVIDFRVQKQKRLQQLLKESQPCESHLTK
jgi:hypothetical protein